MSEPKPATYLTAEEWIARVKAAAELADRVIADLLGQANGPGEAVLAAMLVARAICYGNPPLPDFSWYAARVAELPVVALTITQGKN